MITFSLWKLESQFCWSQVKRSAAYLPYAQEILTYFVVNCKEVYGKSFIVYNSLQHLSEDVRHFECSLNEISAFPFENHQQNIKRLVRISCNPIAQVAKRLAEIVWKRKFTQKCLCTFYLPEGKTDAFCWKMGGMLSFRTIWKTC